MDKSKPIRWATAIAMEALVAAAVIVNPPDPPLDPYDIIILVSQLPGVFILKLIGSQALILCAIFQIGVYYFLLGAVERYLRKSKPVN